jgi:hypothetical protein
MTHTTAAAKAPINFPGVRLAETSQIPEVNRPEWGWLIRFGIRSGAIMTKPESPNGWGFNPAVVTLTLVVVSMVGGLVSMVAIGGYYMGKLDAERTMQEQRIAVAEQTAKAADTKATYVLSKDDQENGHPKATEKKKPAKTETKETGE